MHNNLHILKEEEVEDIEEEVVVADENIQPNGDKIDSQSQEDHIILDKIAIYTDIPQIHVGHYIQNYDQNPVQNEPKYLQSNEESLKHKMISKEP